MLNGAVFSSYGNENLDFDEHGLIRLRIARSSDQAKRTKISLALGRRPDDHPSLSDLGLWAGLRPMYSLLRMEEPTNTVLSV
jgi:nuclear transport factor 2 (NTF2) superfamily protein